MNLLGSAGKKSDAYLLIGIVGVLVLLGTGTHYYAKWDASRPENIAKAAEEKMRQGEKEAKEAAELEAFKQTPAGKLCDKHPTWTRNDCEKLIKGDTVWLGMHYDMLVYLRGEPKHVNVSNYGGGNKYQYCWDFRYTVSCFYDNDGDQLMDSFN